jgi:tetratricopeptide (TPR) repeat protein
MGRKQPRAWKYIYFCIASLIGLLLFNCATVKNIQQQMEVREYLLRGDELLAQRNYEDALSEYGKVLAMSTYRHEKAEALFKTGLIYAHFGYLKKDYDKSLDSFVRILNECPESPLADQAKIWAGVLQEHKRISQMIEKSKQMTAEPEKPKTRPDESGRVREHLLRGQALLAQGDYEGSFNESQKVLSMSAHRPPEDEALFNLGLIYAHSGNPKKDFGKSIDFFKKLITDYPGSPLVEQARMWVGILQKHEDLNEVIQKLKQVDLEVEERKREKAK